ncbi:MAG: 30S ribosomal protein S6e [Desulfurococcales archaeon]|jgi:small subunit ribosomal protein S6e|nr:30S ribosomal protein S6e [Desulfurococcales archaeon]
MPEIKVVISDPGVKMPKRVKVIAVADSSLAYGEDEKTQKTLPKARISPTLKKILDPQLGVISIRLKKQDGSRVKITAQIVTDDKIPEGEIRLPEGFMREKLGAERALAEVMRAPSFQIALSPEKSSKLYGLRIGDAIDGSIVGLPGYRLIITGGSDKAGAPMIPYISGPVKKYVLLSGPPGFHPTEDGLRRRKFIRGNTVNEDTVQINTVIARRSESG